MFSAQFLGFVALGLALVGLMAVVLEAALKSPSTILDLVLDSHQVAFPEPRAESADRVTIGYLAPKAPTIADQRAAA